MRLLLVLAAIYDSTGSSDAGRRAKGEHAVSSEAIQRLATLKPSPPPLLLPLNCVWEQSPPMWDVAVMRLPLHDFK